MRTKYANKLARIEYNCDWCVLLSLYAFGCSVFNAELCHGRQVALCLSILSDFIAFLLFIRLSDRYSVLSYLLNRKKFGEFILSSAKSGILRIGYCCEYLRNMPPNACQRSHLINRINKMNKERKNCVKLLVLFFSNFQLPQYTSKIWTKNVDWVISNVDQIRNAVAKLHI